MILSFVVNYTWDELSEKICKKQTNQKTNKYVISSGDPFIKLCEFYLTAFVTKNQRIETKPYFKRICVIMICVCRQHTK